MPTLISRLPLVCLCIGLPLVVFGCSTSSDRPAPGTSSAVEQDLGTEPVEAAAPGPEAAADDALSRWQGRPEVQEEPWLLAEQLAAAERAVLDPNVRGAELAWHGHLQQLIYRRLVEHAELRNVVLSLPDDVITRAKTNLDAGLNLRALITPGRELPSWRIVEPAPMDELLGYYQAAEAEFGVPWQYLAAVHLVETVMGRIRGTSSAGAQGPMQFIPATWAAYGDGDINDTRDAIRAAARYLRASGAPRSMANALFAYNPSQYYVRAVTGYAEAMRAEPNAYRGYYNWQVYYLTTQGDMHLPVGYLKE